MSANKIDYGIQLCEEILRDMESPYIDLMALSRKIRRLAQLLDKEEEFSRVLRRLKWLQANYNFLSRSENEKWIGLMHQFISKQWMELKFGGIIETIFENNKKFVDAKLVQICPNAVQKFNSAYDRLRGENPEDWAQAVTTCRRILKDFADIIYPPTDKIIKDRKLDDDHYINRLWAFASEKIGSSTNKELIQSEIDYIGNRIDALYSLVCKGTHGKISKYEADMAVIRTHLLIGDIIKLGNL